MFDSFEKCLNYTNSRSASSWQLFRKFAFVCMARVYVETSTILRIQSLARINHAVLCYMNVNVKLLRNQSWVNLLFYVSRDSILDSIHDNLFLILDSCRNRESSRELRLLTDCQLTFEWYCILQYWIIKLINLCWKQFITWDLSLTGKACFLVLTWLQQDY